MEKAKRLGVSVFVSNFHWQTRDVKGVWRKS